MIVSFTLDKVSGLRRVHDVIVEYLRRRGMYIYSVYSSPYALALDPAIEPRTIDYAEVALTTWYMGRTTATAVSRSRISRWIWIPFVEGKPIIDERDIDTINSKAVLLAPTTFVKHKLKEVGLRVADVVYIPPTLDAPRIDESTVRYIKRIAGDRKIVLYIANYEPRKNVDTFIEACRILTSKRRDVVCILLTNRVPKSYRGIDDTRIIVVPSLGSLDESRYYGYIASCDVYVHPAGSEGLGIPILEAQMLGKPTIVVNRSPMNEVCSTELCTYIDYERIEIYEWLGGEEIVEYAVIDPKKLAEAIDATLSELSQYETIPRHEMFRRIVRTDGLEKIFEHVRRMIES